MQTSTWHASDGVALTLYTWDDVKNPKAVIQIFHGMDEHMGRYNDFANFFNANGYIVVGDDHRGHGKSAGTREKVGKLVDDGDIYYQTVKDEMKITRDLVEKYKLPILIYGHSYGSFLAQSYMLQQPLNAGVKGMLLTGAAKQDGFKVKMAKFLCMGKKEKPANQIAKMTFGEYDKKFNEGKNAWLTHDKDIVKAYNNDEFIVPVFSKGFYKFFFRNIGKIFHRPNAAAVKDLPVLIACGKEDGVGEYGKLSQELFDKFKELGFTKVEFKLYDGMRHEIINETGRAEVYKDLLTFFNETL